jgi:hypothetical protein
MNVDNDQQLQILKNTLGLQKKDKPFRNFYMVYNTSNQLPDLYRLVSLGYMESNRDLPGSMALSFKATQKGIDLVYSPKKKKNKKDVIRIGDKVKIINPKIIKRVGYPKCAEDIIRNDMTRADASSIDSLISDLCKSPRKANDSYGFDYAPALFNGEYGRTQKRMEKLFDHIVKEIAYIRLIRAGFGGNERTIHYETDVSDKDLVGLEFVVVDKEIAKTGTRKEGTSAYFNGSYDIDAEGPSFEETGTHIILTVEWKDPKFIYGDGKDPFAFMSKTITTDKQKRFQIEACDVEKISHNACLD